MLPLGYDPENYGGRVWWAQDNPGMCAIWGTQESYDKFKVMGGKWWQYANIAKQRRDILRNSQSSNEIKLPEFSLENVVIEENEELRR